MAATISELLRPAFLTVLFIVLVSSDISEDVHVSYSVDIHPSVEQFVIEHESMDKGRYRRQATGENATVASTTTQIPTTPAPTTVVEEREEPQTPAPTITNTSSARPTTTPRQTTTPTPTPHTHSAPPVTTTPTGTDTTTPAEYKDSHLYYQSRIIPNGWQENWIDLSQAKKHATLSESHRTAVTVKLGFKFRFYGHNITNVTIATGGFLYASPFLHQWLTATQYIAPLMANFDLRIGEDSDVFYDDFGDKFAVQWRNVVLKDQNSTGSFNFQVQLHTDGTIKFLYKQLPIEVGSISSSQHPVKVGLSDAFYIDTYIKEKGIRRRTIYEYHRVSFHGDQIDQGTVIVMTPLPTCNVITDCRDCVNHEHVNFECKWCGAVGRCSDGIDWHRSQWINSGCTKLLSQSAAISNETLCDVTTTFQSTTSQTTSKSTTRSTTTSLPLTTTKISTTSKTTMTKSSTTATAKGSQRSKCDWVGSGDDARNDTDCLTTSLNTSVDSISLTTTNPSLNQTVSASTNSLSYPSTSAANGNVLSTTSSTTNNIVETTYLTTTHVPRIVSSSTPASKLSTANSGDTKLHNWPFDIDVPYKVTHTENTEDMVEGTICDNITDGVCRGREDGFPTGAVVAVVLILLVVFGGIGVWIFYAYTHPTSASGMWLMEHRPSQMKSKIANIKFWKSSTPAGTKYAVESTA